MNHTTEPGKIMRQSLHSLFAVAALLYCSATAAEDLSYIVKIGHMHVNLPAAPEPDNISLLVAYDIENLIADFSVAADYSQSFNKGTSLGGEDIDVKTSGLYLRYRSTGTIFSTVRLGIGHERITTGNTLETDTAFSYAVGLGLVIGHTRWALDASEINGHTTFIGLSLQYE